MEDELKKEDINDLVSKRFPSPATNLSSITKRNHHQVLNIITPNNFLELLCKKLDSELPNVLKFPRIHLMSANKLNYKTVDLLNGNLNRYWYHDRFFQCLFRNLDLNESKVYKSQPVKHKRKLSSNICKLCFNNKSIGFTNLPRIFSDLVIRFKIHK